LAIELVDAWNVILQDEARPLFSPTLEAAFLAGCGRDWFPEQAIQVRRLARVSQQGFEGCLTLDRAGDRPSTSPIAADWRVKTGAISTV
jgi:hypothetical protein